MASKLYDYTPTELQEILDNSSSYKDVLRNLNMCDHGSNYITLKKVIGEYNLDLTKINNNRINNNLQQIKRLNSKHTMSLDEILIKNSAYNNGTNLKERLFNSNLKERKCECCGNTEWLGKPIPLHLHHKDGDHKNNELNNLELLCPNCHAFTDTYAGKNISHKPKKVDDKFSTNTNKKIIQRGISEDGQRFYDGYGNYKTLCPTCKTNFKNKAAKQCRECSDKKRLTPKISKEELFKIMETNSYYSAADLLGVDRETVSRWHKYYINEENKNNNIKLICSDKAPPRDILKTKIRTMTFVQVGKEYGVTDNSVRKWCDAYSLPRLTSVIKKYSDEEWETI